MRLIFAGTPEFAQIALQALIAQGHEPVLVLTQPDRPAGRGLRMQASPVKETATVHQLPLLQPQGLRLDGRFAEDAHTAQAALQKAVYENGAQAMVVAAYGLILPGWVLKLPPLGCINIHASLLPRWRGAAPIHRAIEAGDASSGITIMQMDEGLDTGAILAHEALPLSEHETNGSLHDRLAALGGALCHRVLVSMAIGQARAVAQPSQGVTYAAKIVKSETQIDWQQSADLIARKVRALNPAPGAWTTLNGQMYKVWMAQPATTQELTIGLADGTNKAENLPGCIANTSANGIGVHTGQGLLCLTELQRAGGKRMPLAELLKGQGLRVGDVFSFQPPMPSP